MKKKPISPEKMDSFVAYMEAFDDGDLPDGAWFQMLVDGAQEFLSDFKIKGSGFDAAHQYLRARQAAREAAEKQAAEAAKQAAQEPKAKESDDPSASPAPQ